MIWPLAAGWISFFLDFFRFQDPVGMYVGVFCREWGDAGTRARGEEKRPQQAEAEAERAGAPRHAHNNPLSPTTLPEHRALGATTQEEDSKQPRLL